MNPNRRKSSTLLLIGQSNDFYGKIPGIKQDLIEGGRFFLGEIRNKVISTGLWNSSERIISVFFIKKKMVKPIKFKYAKRWTSICVRVCNF